MFKDHETHSSLIAGSELFCMCEFAWQMQHGNWPWPMNSYQRFLSFQRESKERGNTGCHSCQTNCTASTNASALKEFCIGLRSSHGPRIRGLSRAQTPTASVVDISSSFSLDRHAQPFNYGTHHDSPISHSASQEISLKSGTAVLLDNINHVRETEQRVR